MVIELATQEEEDLIRFLFDTTLEQWTNDKDEVLNNILNDPTVNHSLETLMPVAGIVMGMIPLLQRIRDRLDRKVEV